MFLQKVLENKREELEYAKSRLPFPELRARCQDLPPTHDFRASLTHNDPQTRIIAELKHASPSKGVLRASFDPVSIARIYQAHGAAAVSVLTERKYFLGSLEYLKAVREVISLPVLRKDFIFDPYQLYEARVYGADAVLLICALLSQAQLEDLYQEAGELSLQILPETHNLKELERVLLLKSPILGINNRDLQTFTTNLDVTLRLLTDVPPEKVVVSESGIHRREDIMRLEEAGVAAVLIGEELMRAEDIEKKLKQLLMNS